MNGTFKAIILLIAAVAILAYATPAFAQATGYGGARAGTGEGGGGTITGSYGAGGVYQYTTGFTGRGQIPYEYLKTTDGTTGGVMEYSGVAGGPQGVTETLSYTGAEVTQR